MRASLIMLSGLVLALSACSTSEPAQLTDATPVTPSASASAQVATRALTVAGVEVPSLEVECQGQPPARECLVVPPVSIPSVTSAEQLLPLEGDSAGIVRASVTREDTGISQFVDVTAEGIQLGLLPEGRYMVALSGQDLDMWQFTLLVP